MSGGIPAAFQREIQTAEGAASVDQALVGRLEGGRRDNISKCFLIFLMGSSNVVFVTSSVQCSSR